ncbi:MAG: hypothetical protein AAB456_02475 [Patescibacteria group bacterium]
MKIWEKIKSGWRWFVGLFVVGAVIASYGAGTISLTWDYSYVTPKFDTASNFLEDNQYALNEDNTGYFVKLPEIGRVFTIPLNYKTYLVDSGGVSYNPYIGIDLSKMTQKNVIGNQFITVFNDKEAGKKYFEYQTSEEYWNVANQKIPNPSKSIFKIAYIPLVNAAIAFDNSASASAASASSLTKSFTPVDITNGIAAVGALHRSGTQRTISTVTYAGNNMTQAVVVANVPGNIAELGQVAIYYQTGIPSGASNAVITLNAAADLLNMGIISYTGAHQTVQNGGTGTADVVTSATTTIDVTSATGEIVIDAVETNDNLVDVTTGGGQTRRVAFQVTGWGTGAIMSEEAGAATVTMSHTGNGTASWGQVAWSIKPAVTAAEKSKRGIIQ